MTQYETIKKVRRTLKTKGGLKVSQIAMATRLESKAVRYALEVMGDAYIDRWDGAKAVYDLIETPPPCPKPR